MRKQTHLERNDLTLQVDEIGLGSNEKEYTLRIKLVANASIMASTHRQHRLNL